ncbi:MAG: hypothetical protein QW756_00020 [Nitrososphaerota archaeon]
MLSRVVLLIPILRIFKVHVLVATVILRAAMWVKRVLTVVPPLDLQSRPHHSPVGRHCYMQTIVELMRTTGSFAGLDMTILIFSTVFPAIYVLGCQKSTARAPPISGHTSHGCLQRVISGITAPTS